MATSPDLVTCRNVTKTYVTEIGVTYALEDVSFAVEPQGSVAVVGPSGCGKSTLLLLLAGLEKPTAGRVEFKGSPLLGPHRDIGLVLQDYGLFPWKTVRQNIELGLRIRKDTVDKAVVTELLTLLEIADKMDFYPQQLSGGQRQRVALARALALKPRLLLLDEPFAALDTLTRERLQELLSELRRTRRFGMVLVTHNIEEAVRLGSTILIMAANPGRIAALQRNDCMGSADSCGPTLFHEMTREVRSRLERSA